LWPFDDPVLLGERHNRGDVFGRSLVASLELDELCQPCFAFCQPSIGTRSLIKTCGRPDE